MLIYAAIGAFGLLFLLGLLFIGDVGDHDVDHGGIDHGVDTGGPSFLSARVMAAFMTAFGVGGVVARYYSISHPAASGIGVVSGFAMAGIVYQFARMLYSQQASSEVHIAGLVGHTGEVTVTIPDNGVGQVTLTAGGERTTHIARSAGGEAIAAGTEVLVDGMRGESLIVSRVRPSEREERT